MTTLWKKTDVDVSEVVADFCTGEDPVWDLSMAQYDVYASIAHATMLDSIGVIDAKELEAIKIVLSDVLGTINNGSFCISTQQEDVHTALEQILVKELGDTGKKIHTARSRNDQSLTNIRLYSKSELFDVTKILGQCIHTLLTLAQTEELTMMPGFTHFRKAMPSSVGLWASSYVELLLDDWKGLEYVLTLNNQSPLGSAASYGVPLPINRELTAKLLDFSNIQQNVLGCQNSRIKITTSTVHALLQIMTTLNKLSTDLILMSGESMGYFSLDPSMCTGSSIMPQKQNPDPLELIRGKTNQVLGFYTHLASLDLGVPSGYHRDYQDLKSSLIQSFEITKSSLSVMSMIIESLTINHESIKDALTPELFATHMIYDLVQSGTSFRDAYQDVAKNIDSVNIPKDPTDILLQSTHIGGTGNLGLEDLRTTTNELANTWETKCKLFWKTIKKLMN